MFAQGLLQALDFSSNAREGVVGMVILCLQIRNFVSVTNKTSSSKFQVVLSIKNSWKMLREVYIVITYPSTETKLSSINAYSS